MKEMGDICVLYMCVLISLSGNPQPMGRLVYVPSFFGVFGRFKA